MKNVILVSTLMLAASAWAAPPKTNFVDHSTGSLIDAAAAKTVMAASVPAKVWKVYPASKYAFVSQVEGGVTTSKMCVVAARVMLLPVTPALKAVLFRPEKTATAYDAVANADADKCKALARDKLKAATEAVVSALVKS